MDTFCTDRDYLENERQQREEERKKERKNARKTLTT
jgi:hypothetical protein